MSEVTHTDSEVSEDDGGPPPVSDFELSRAQVQALEQLLEVHERTSLEQATRLEESLRAGAELLARERSARAAQTESEQRLRLALDAGRMGTWECSMLA